MTADEITLGRRSLLAGSAAALAGSVLFSGTGGATESDPRAVDLVTDDGEIPPLEFYFPSGLLDAEGGPLTDDSLVAVTAEPEAGFGDAEARWKYGPYTKNYEEDGTWTRYPDDVDIPLVAVDDQRVEGTVVGMTSLLVQDGTTWSRGNAEFMVNLFDRTIRGQGDATILFHEFENPAVAESNVVGPRNHMYYTLDRFERFREYAAEEGYEIISDDATPADRSGVSGETPDQTDFVATLLAENPEAVWLPVPNQFTEPALRALENYVSRGGVVVLQDCSDFLVEEWDRSDGYARGNVDEPVPNVDPGVNPEDPGLPDPENRDDQPFNEDQEQEGEVDPTTSLNEIAERLGVGFRFNDGLTYDETNNAGNGSGFRQIPVTAQFNTDVFPTLFEDRPGIEPNDKFYRYEGTVGQVIDGDTFKITFGDVPRVDVGVGGGGAEGSLGSQREQGRRFEVRVLGVDTPEDGGGDEPFERPVEWEGLAHQPPNSIPTITRLQFDTACSLLDANGDPLTDEAVVPVWAEPSATTEDAAGDGHVDYGDGAIPLAATGDETVGIGSLLVNDAAEPPSRRGSTPTYEFLQNVWDDYLGGGATVLYDEGHGQPATLADHAGFADACDFAPEERANDEKGRYASDFSDNPTADYDIRPTSNLVSELDRADAVWLTPPKQPFDDAELARLREFVADGGSVFMHGRADGTGEAFTAHLNEVAAAVDAPFRFNSDQVLDEEQNAGSDGGQPARPTTGRFGDRNGHPYFLLRQSDAMADIGVGGFPSSYGPGGGLVYWGQQASDYCRSAMANERVVHELDPNATIIGGLGRLYGHTYYADEYPDGKPYGQRAIREGYARAYDASHTLHDEFLATEIEARVNDRRVWKRSGPANSPPIRNRDVEELYLPQAASVRTANGPLGRGRAPVFAESTAVQTGDPSVRYRGASGIPLAGVDRQAGAAMIGAPLLAENYDIREDDYKSLSFVEDIDPIRVNTAGFENFVFLTNLIDALSEKADGAVFIDGGHFQFGGSVDRFGGNYTFSAEDARYYERFLEGVGIDCEGINDLPANLTGDSLVEARGIIISTPREAFDEAEIEALRAFRREGGAVVFVGSGEAPAEERALLNDAAERFGTDLRLNDDRVRDEQHNLKGQSRLPTTGNLNPAFERGRWGAFSAVEPEPWTGPGDGLPAKTLGGPNTPDVTASGSWSTDATPAPYNGTPATARRTGPNDTYTVVGGEPFKIEITVEELNTTAQIRHLFSQAASTWKVVRDRGDVLSVEDGEYGNQRTVKLRPVEPSEVAGDATATRTYYVQPPTYGAEVGRTPFNSAQFGGGTAWVSENNSTEISSGDADADFIVVPGGGGSSGNADGATPTDDGATTPDAADGAGSSSDSSDGGDTGGLVDGLVGQADD